MPKTKFILNNIINILNGRALSEIYGDRSEPRPECESQIFSHDPSIGVNYGSGLFSGQIVYVAINPQTEPPGAPSNILSSR